MFRYIAIDPSLEDNDAVFIQEDDVIFSPSGFMSKWNELWKILQNDTNWDLVYAGNGFVVQLFDNAQTLCLRFDHYYYYF